jgi:hypothetical protein
MCFASKQLTNINLIKLNMYICTHSDSLSEDCPVHNGWSGIIQFDGAIRESAWGERLPIFQSAHVGIDLTDAADSESGSKVIKRLLHGGMVMEA